MVYKQRFCFHFLFCIFFVIITFTGCKQSTSSLHDFIQESLDYYISNGAKINETKNYNTPSPYRDNDYSFSFIIKRNSTYITEDLSDFAFQSEDTIFLLDDYDYSPLNPLYFSLYRESELVLQEKASDGLGLSENIFQFPGKYTFAVTFQKNKIIQEACFQIVIE